MKTSSALSFDVVPPIVTPWRLLRIGPLWGVAAGVALLAAAGSDLASRWSSRSLAITHLLTIGFLATVVCGALLQVVPVICGRRIPGDGRISKALTLLLPVGVAALAAGWWAGDVRLLRVAAVALPVAFLALLVPLGWLLSSRLRGGASLLAVRLAAAALLVAVALGTTLAVGHGFPEQVALRREWTNLHAAWAVGSFLVLIMGVGYQVIPMFHVAPSYPSAVAVGAPPGVVAGLVLTSLGGGAERWGATLGAVAIVSWSVTSLGILARRRRRRADAVVRFWQTAHALATVAAVLLAARSWAGPDSPLSATRVEVLLGVLWVFGVVSTVVCGMLQKIVPFLTFLHLQRRCVRRPDVAAAHLPPMTALLPEWRARVQLALHGAAVAAAVAFAVEESMALLWGVLLVADFGWLAWSVQAATLRYRRAGAAIDEALGGAAS